jgi:hypothetical protein
MLILSGGLSPPALERRYYSIVYRKEETIVPSLNTGGLASKILRAWAPATSGISATEEGPSTLFM